MPTIKISIKEKRATVEGAPIIICGNSDYSVSFTFDSEWTSHSTKTARFAYKQGGEFRYEDKIFSGTTCAVPALIDTDLVAIGVFAGNLRTSTPAAVKCAPSVLCLGKLPADPLPSVYNQLITLINTRTPADDAWHNVTANALKGSASGETVTLTDVSPVEHELGVRVTAPNPTAVTITRKGKNMVPSLAEGYSVMSNGVTFSASDNGGVSASGTPTGVSRVNLYNGAPLATKGVITLSLTGDFQNIVPDFQLVDASGAILKHVQSGTKTTLNLDNYPTVTKWDVSLKRQTNGVECSGTVYVQLEEGETTTDYQPYSAATTHTPDEDGVVAGVASLAPSTTLLTDTAGVTIDVTYNRDITKAINALEQALLANN